MQYFGLELIDRVRLDSADYSYPASQMPYLLFYLPQRNLAQNTARVIGRFRGVFLATLGQSGAEGLVVADHPDRLRT